jgi:prepilin-type N-terminal cleavage/methylation domain-containing protein
MPRTPNTDRRAGFTLIEVVAVMLIIAMVASLAVTLTSGTGRGRLKALALDTAALLRRERLRCQAMASSAFWSETAATPSPSRATSRSTSWVSMHSGRDDRPWCVSSRMGHRPEQC